MSTREKCSNAILTIIGDQKIGFNKIVEKIGTDFSRGTINKYLQELCQETLVKQSKNRGPRPYYLSAKGREKVGKILFVQIAAEIVSREPEKIKVSLETFKRLIDTGIEISTKDQTSFFSCVSKLCSQIGFVTFLDPPEQEKQDELLLNTPRKHYPVRFP